METDSEMTDKIALADTDVDTTIMLCKLWKQRQVENLPEMNFQEEKYKSEIKVLLYEINNKYNTAGETK